MVTYASLRGDGYVIAVLQGDGDPAVLWPDIADRLVACPTDVDCHWWFDGIKFLLPAPPAPLVPDTVPVWKARSVLRRRGLLTLVETAMAAGSAELQEAFGPYGPRDWSRDGLFVTEMIAALGKTTLVDQLFMEADAIAG